MSLYDNPVEEHSLIQELGVLPASPARLDLRISNQDPRNRPGFMIWRMLEAAESGSGRVLREGRMEVPATVDSKLEEHRFPPAYRSRRPSCCLAIGPGRRAGRLTC